MNDIKLTQYSHGAGCGCKISPKVLSAILHSNEAYPDDSRLIVGNHTRDDAAVYDLENGMALISTTDFFMPIVDDPYDFGRIASANAISDVYAMGGKPVLAIAVLGWPIDKLEPAVARRVIEGSRKVCAEAGIALAGGHSIDSPEPIFGLAVNGLVARDNVKTNSGATEGCALFLTKPLGIGIYTTAEKKGLLKEEHMGSATQYMTRLNSIGELLGGMPEVKAMTDITGFGFLGHLVEMCEGSDLNAEVYFDHIRTLADLDYYISQRAIPGGTGRNWDSYGDKIGEIAPFQKSVLCDPQTSGGLLIAVEESKAADFSHTLMKNGLGAFTEPVGRLISRSEGHRRVKVL